MDKQDAAQALPDEDAAQAGVTDVPGRRERRTTALASAVLVAVGLQAKTMAYNNYSLWRFEFTAVELAVALACALALYAFASERLEGQGVQWAQRYVAPGAGFLWQLMRNLVPTAAYGALMCAGLSVANVTAVAQGIYRETVEMLPLEVVARFLADIPTCVTLCLVVRLVLWWRAQRVARKQGR